MRNGPPDEVLAGAPLYSARITSWLGGRMLAATVPIIAGRVTGKATQEVIEELSLTVPRFAAGAPGGDVKDWRPGKDAQHSLARYGQTLDVTTIIESVVTGEIWETRIGRYQIKDWDDDDAGTVTVKAESLLARPRDDKLLSLTSPTGTLKSEARRLAPAGMGVSFDPKLIDRPCSPAMSWSRSRIENLQEIADAWPALLRVDAWGQIAFRAPLPDVPKPVVTLRDGKGGTLIAAPRSDSRGGVPNVVVATTGSSATADVQGVAAITSGPMSINGDYGVVVKEWSSSLLENASQAQAAARTMLDNAARPAQAVPVRIAPDPRLEIDDPVAVTREGDTPLWGWVTAWDLPLTADGGDMRIDVGVSG
ncbi:hypothetical protein QE418_000606 [Microbacterium testaceum]|uniref:hypothetical protein n=1 Tax=Microbacterium TaxID=33882 RepID=UPI0027887F33|nr:MULTISPECIES: hypothetical protein [Microbacterium]MDQ1111158.1 hypothetical protein [Microbacterium testaceum]MDR6098303.1 hypothetical protein [Microbacterium sp. SORGH_AS_0454]